MEQTNANFAANWSIVKDWNEGARYRTFDKIQAIELYNSITTKKGGVLSWIRQYW
jgi:hypothetical protein